MITISSIAYKSCVVVSYSIIIILKLDKLTSETRKLLRGIDVKGVVVITSLFITNAPAFTSVRSYKYLNITSSVVSSIS